MYCTVYDKKEDRYIKISNDFSFYHYDLFEEEDVEKCKQCKGFIEVVYKKQYYGASLFIKKCKNCERLTILFSIQRFLGLKNEHSDYTGRQIFEKNEYDDIFINNKIKWFEETYIIPYLNRFE